MVAFINSLSLFQQIILAIAAPAFVILLLQFVMLLFGFGGMGGNRSKKTGNGPDESDGAIQDTKCCTAKTPPEGKTGIKKVFGLFTGLMLFTFNGILAFFAAGGWVALLVSLTGSLSWSIIAGVLAGTLADIVYALLFKSVPQPNKKEK